MFKLIALSASVLMFLSSCAYQRIADLTMVSTRNVDTSKKYVLFERAITGKAKTKGRDALKVAIDNACEKAKGEYLANVKIYVKNNGKKVKVVGDVWGDEAVKVNVTTTVDVVNELKVGDTVAYKSGGKLKEGKIVGINANAAIVELADGEKKEIQFKELTKLQK